VNEFLNVATAPWDADLVAAGRRGGVVDVLSVHRGQRLASFETLWDGSGWRGTVVAGDVPVIVAGAWERHGVCGYDLSGERLWQDRSRTAVNVVTAVADGRVVVSYARRATRVLDAATGEEIRSLRGIERLVPLSPDLSLGVGGGWYRLMDRSLDPLGSRIATGLNLVWFAATDGEHLAIWELGGPVRVLDSDRRERARLAVDQLQIIVHDPVTGTWVGLRRADDGRSWLFRFSDDGEILDERRVGFVRDATSMRGGRNLVTATDEGVQLLNCVDGSFRTLFTA